MHDKIQKARMWLAMMEGDLAALKREPTSENLSRLFCNVQAVNGMAARLESREMQAVAELAQSVVCRLRSGELKLSKDITISLLSDAHKMKELLKGLERQAVYGQRRGFETLFETHGPAESSFRHALTENEVIKEEFVLETKENLEKMDEDIRTLEKKPTDSEALARVFRILHTVKGMAGFMGLMEMQAVAHGAEILVERLRSHELIFNSEIAGELRGQVATIRKMLDSLAKNGH